MVFLRAVCTYRHDNIAPKVEFSDHSIDPEEVDANWTSRGEVKHPTPGTCHPALVPESVEFRLPVAEEVAESLPDGYFTCFEVYLMQCHLWFPLPRVIVRLFIRFGLAIGHIKPCGLQHILKILVLSYERGMPLDVDHLEALLMPKGSSDTVQLGPRPNRAIIAGFVSNYRVWKKTRWGRKGTFDCLYASFGFDDIRSYVSVSHFVVTNPLPPAPDGLNTNIDLLRSGISYWASFTPKRVRRAVALHRSRFQPDLPVEEGEDPSMDGFVPYEAPEERERSRTRNDKHIVVDDDEANKGCFSENLLGDYFNGEPIDLDEVLGSNLPTAEGGSDKGPEFTKTSRLVNGGLLMMNRAPDASNQEARMAQFRADKADMEIARMREELECSRRCEGELVTREIRRAYRRGKREMADDMKNRRA
ncbi:hypothetical protein F2Q70_00002155 [Brassica cretica]|uniref:Uncharacterized protein n=1 Tax=Brassica cretica TaxID=69181 RepID=A0A8S9ITP9_BRACR|nr:hypothetical protein F2Q70_00002155 [Brassica cretica]